MAVTGVQGEVSVNSIMPLAVGVSASWTSGSGQTIYTFPATASGLIVFHIVGRNAAGTQPISVTFTSGGVVIAAATTVFAGLIGSTYTILNLTNSLTTIPTTGNLTVTPIAASSGASCLFDVFGYVF